MSKRVVIALLAVSAVLAGAAGAATYLSGAIDTTSLEPEQEVTAPTEPSVSAEAAALPAGVTPVATSATAQDPLELVEAAHTVVVTAPGDDRLVAAEVAIALSVPLVITDRTSEGTGGQASEATDATEDANGDASAAAATTLRRLGVVRAVVIPSAVAERAARDGAVREIVPLPIASPDRRTVRELIAAAATAPEPAEARGGDADAAGTTATDSAAGPTNDPTGPTNDPTGPTDDPTDRSAADDDGPAVDADALAEIAASLPPGPPASSVVVLIRPRGEAALQLAVAARAVGHTVVPTSANDLRADPDVIAALAARAEDGDPPPVVIGGPGMASLRPRAVARQAQVASTGVQLPGGGQLVIDPDRPDARRYVGLYGAPGTAALGAFGEQPVDGAVTRARDLARTYQRTVDAGVEVIPAFEIIATVASASAGPDGDFSNELTIAELQPAVRAARRAGLYVLLDLQPGRTDFVTQAKRYRRLLRRPHVGLALDPEWRLRPGERHLQQIGSVGIDEVNAVADWLATLTRRNRLPQKMFLIHQFRLSMVRERERLDTSHDELAYVVQMDGQGPQGTKLETWAAITASPPPGLHFGWKNFYDEDTPVRSPADTMAITPPPVFVSYQ